uniref:uncharacterized protein LOC122601258 n=1 Tax=Erigeron canadensis TaxID=72917 RepID=UPI001CB9CBE5|nr:uncharacterized protein LOC122601258 [Erigeron canadensis]
MCQLFKVREQHASTHTLDAFDIDKGVYKVRARYQRNAQGGNDFTVKFKDKTCSCGIWQTQRFSCSHAIGVCGHTDTNVGDMLSRYYTTRTWRSQYQATFNPLRDVAYWREPTWMIKADSSNMVRQRGRRQTRRIRNEMDNPDNSSTQSRKCGICSQPDHNKSSVLIEDKMFVFFLCIIK